nr:MAG TPA: villin-like protein [Bacteriophage sp.]
MSDEEFAQIFNDAQWLHSQQVITQQANALGMIS